MTDVAWNRLGHRREELVSWLIEEAPFESYPEILAIEHASETEPEVVTLEFGGVVVDEDAEWKQRWRNPIEHIERFSLRAEGVVRYEAVGRGTAAAHIVAYDVIEVDTVTGFVIQTTGPSITLVAKRYVALVKEPIKRQKIFKPTPEEVTFRGFGPLTAGELRKKLDPRGASVRIFGNWRNSGQSFGAAFVDDITEPPLIDDAATLNGAWLIVPDRFAPAAPPGLWLAGNSLPGGYYATVQKGPDTPHPLWKAVLEGLASLPAVDCVTSGNVLFNSFDEFRHWVQTEELNR